ncbi:Mycolic acid cyclopropane synthetase [Streptomyces sp. 2224.1]|uniref:class I SAM-dependent methyltransferase n=1 Tax=Streptomyces sp. 2224.1 TaxID=1881020 RepID=UPI00089728B8|nr:class I SAM-dependent methyltransferase [Streptomyces sp. 2224.1]SED78960.1 Mycolic acid cyclopropane synthetase [Streptomyces sp. 2224.1]
MTRVAPRLAALLAEHFAGDLPVRLRAWDGSEAGPKTAPVVVLRSPRALRRLLWQPGELGLAQAYIAGDLDVEGDLAEGLSRVWRSVREHGPAPTAPGPRQLARMALAALRLGALGPRPPAPGAPQARLRGTPHSTARDRAAIVADRVQELGLSELVEVELRHYRYLTKDGYDAVCAIEMGEHVGDAAYPGFVARLHALVRPGGRVLIQQMSRGAAAPGGGAFIESYIAPDMHMRPLGETVGLLEAGGLEVRSVESLREHYARTIAAWHQTLETRWKEFVALEGEPTARVWRLYPAGAGLAFTERRMGVDQILAVRTAPDGEAVMPTTPHDWCAREARQ